MSGLQSNPQPSKQQNNSKDDDVDRMDEDNSNDSFSENEEENNNSSANQPKKKKMKMKKNIKKVNIRTPSKRVKSFLDIQAEVQHDIKSSEENVSLQKEKRGLQKMKNGYKKKLYRLSVLTDIESEKAYLEKMMKDMESGAWKTSNQLITSQRNSARKFEEEGQQQGQ